MNKTSNKTNPYEKSPEAKWKTTIVVVITVAALGYLFLRPVLNAQFGWKLPDFLGAEEKVAEKKDKPKEKKDADGKLDTKFDGAKNSSDAKSESKKEASSAATSQTPTKPSSPKKTQSTSKSGSTKTNSNAPRGPPKSSGSKPGNSKSNSEPKLGQLTKLSSGDFKSTAGLIYGKGSRDGTRLKHVMKHAEDDLSKPVHGVFDGSQEEVLALIDQAYTLAKKNSKNVTSSKQRDRTVYTVYFSKRIGYVGGQKGKRTKNPMCKELSLVLEGNRVITAYPK